MLPIDVRLHRRAAHIVADRESYGHRVSDAGQDMSLAFRGEEVFFPFVRIFLLVVILAIPAIIPVRSFDNNPEVRVVYLSSKLKFVFASLLEGACRDRCGKCSHLEFHSFREEIDAIARLA